MIQTLVASLKKESLVLSRDLHALLVLFVMPVIFVLIMSLALQDQFDGKSTVMLAGQIHNQENSITASKFRTHLENNASLRLSDSVEKNHLFKLTIRKGFRDAVTDEFNGEPIVDIEFSAELGLRERYLIEAAVKESFALLNVLQTAEELGYDDEYAKVQLLKQGAIRSIGSGKGGQQKPSATQQNVPAWLVFSMFFISIPLSTTVIGERQLKTLTRILTMGLSPATWYGAKLLPYMLINLLQLGLMLSVGVLVIPLFGGQALDLDINITALIAITLAVSIAALGYSSLIATLAKTTEQATILSGTGSIVFGAVGGIMVPSFVMPEFMRWITLCSPMGWGLQGFLDILVRDGSLASIALESMVLCSFGITLLLIAMLSLKRQRNV